jgi:glycosyltransferase involved in cell wall biosynthesis
MQNWSSYIFTPRILSQDMKILMLSPVWPLPANNGGLVRISQIFCELSKKHDVFLISPGGAIQAGPGRQSVLQERGLPQNRLAYWLKMCFSILSPWPYHAAWYWDNWMKHKVEQLLEDQKFSLVYCHFIYTLPYVAGRKISIVVDQQNADRQYWERKVDTARNIIEHLVFTANLSKTIRFEERQMKGVRAVISVSDDDRTSTEKNLRHLVDYFLIAPNGVGPEMFCSDHGLGDHSASDAAITIGFMGSLDLELNQRAARLLADEIFPALRQKMPERKLKLLIIGRNPPVEILEYPLRTPEIFVTNTVPEVLPYLSKVDILVLPLKGGGGTKLRVLEGMAMGLPIVGSPDSLQGIPGLTHDQNVLIAHSPSEFCELTSRLIKNKGSRIRLGNAARELAFNSYSWQKIATDLDSSLRMLIPDPGPPEPISLDYRPQDMPN